MADLSQSLEGGDPILVGLICMDLDKEQHEEQEGAEQEQGEKGMWSLSHLLSSSRLNTAKEKRKKKLQSLRSKALEESCIW